MPLVQKNTYQCVWGKKTKLAIWRFWQKLGLKQETRRRKGFFFCFVLKSMPIGGFIPAGSRWRRSRRPRGRSDTFGLSEEWKMSWKNQQFYEIISFFSACASDATQRLFLLTFLLFSTFVSIGVEGGDQISLFVFKWAVSFLWVFFEDRSQAGEEVNFKFGSRDERAPVRKGDAFGIWNLEFDI